MGRIFFWACIVVLNTLYMFSALQLPDARWDVIGPRGLPIALSILLYVLVGVDMLVKFTPTMAALKGGGQRTGFKVEPEQLALLGLLVAFIFAAKYVGFLESAFFYITASFTVIATHLRWQVRLLCALVVSLASVAFVWLVFEGLLNIRVA